MKRSKACSACKIRPVRGKRQRYCKECHAEKTRDYRSREKHIIATLKGIINNLRIST